eukprot:gene5190-18414_t
MDFRGKVRQVLVKNPPTGPGWECWNRAQDQTRHLLQAPTSKRHFKAEQPQRGQPGLPAPPAAQSAGPQAASSAISAPESIKRPILLHQHPLSGNPAPYENIVRRLLHPGPQRPISGYYVRSIPAAIISGPSTQTAIQTPLSDVQRPFFFTSEHGAAFCASQRGSTPVAGIQRPFSGLGLKQPQQPQRFGSSALSWGIQRPSAPYICGSS